MIVIHRNTVQPFHPFLFPEHAALVFGDSRNSQPCQKKQVLTTAPAGSEKNQCKGEGESPSNKTSQAKRTDSIPTRFIRSAHLDETTENFVLTVDLPGVLVDDISINDENYRLAIRAERKRGNQVVAKYERSFALDERTIDRENIQATLTDGVLTLSIPKIPLPDKVSLVPMAGKDAPEETTIDKSKFFSMSLDLPGVKPCDLQVTLTPHQEIDIQAQRKRTNSSSPTSRIHRVFSVAENVNLNTSHAELYLNDGVMTLVVPLQDNNSCYSARKIPVNSVASSVDNVFSLSKMEGKEIKVEMDSPVVQGGTKKTEEDNKAQDEEACGSKESEEDAAASDFVEVETVTPDEED